MFAAKGAALRTLDLSRQVGAAVFNPTGEIIAMGSNEVPRAGGGTYWADQEPFDAREYVKGQDSNDIRKQEILLEITQALGYSGPLDELLKLPAVKESQFMDALEYGRIIHAEMSAISDAARLGLSLKESTLYCTTFPCHMCAKHIVAAGIEKVIFLEPYPKSLASDLHADSIQIEQEARGSFQDYSAVKFEHFFGVTPRRYRELFEREKRKNGANFEPYIKSKKRPLIDYKYAFYKTLEQSVIEDGASALGRLMSVRASEHT
ncbi:MULTISPECIES: deaminase [unclassified Aureimonas]|uniref:deaminase n=1 Tax=unclassified Aureimonas TaxID=2615206 RepID=UPI00138ED078|nr:MULTISPECIES: deaminase [unclassified Aureimonas]